MSMTVALGAHRVQIVSSAKEFECKRSPSTLTKDHSERALRPWLPPSNSLASSRATQKGTLIVSTIWRCNFLRRKSRKDTLGWLNNCDNGPDVGQNAPAGRKPSVTPIAAPRGDLGQFLAASYPTERLVDLILAGQIKDELVHLVVETRMREKLAEKGLKPRRRVLLSGPPGTGKTLSASAIAGELQYPLFSVMLHGLITKFMGETAQKLKMIFDAVKTTRGIYLFDEIDALARSQGRSE